MQPRKSSQGMCQVGAIFQLTLQYFIVLYTHLHFSKSTFSYASFTAATLTSRLFLCLHRKKKATQNEIEVEIL